MNQPPEQPYYYAGQPPQTDPQATWSLVLGISSLVCASIFAGIPAIILGNSAKRKIEQSNGQLAGREMASIGVVLGYVSVALFVLAVVGTIAVMAITGASMAFLIKKGPQLQQIAARTMVSSAATQLQNACNRYQTDHGKLPAATAVGTDEEVDAKELMASLSAVDSAGVAYYSPQNNGLAINGLPSDSWAQPMHVAVDLNGDGKVTVGNVDIPGSVVVWSSGPNEQNDHGLSDDVISW